MLHQVLDRTFHEDVLTGLSKPRKEIDCKYFYDERGSQLFDQICELREYYVTRTELSIMRARAGEMANQLGERVALVEFGSGSSVKTRLLLSQLKDPVAYMPLDIAEDHLLKTAAELRDIYPGLDVLPLVADFTQEFVLPETRRQYSHAAVYFPGSTIGNFTPRDAKAILNRIGKLVGGDGGLLIGIDLQKDPAILQAAYDDPAGVTADFNLNLLQRINHELGGDFVLSRFRHKAIYNPSKCRIEIYLVSLADQTVKIGEAEFYFKKNEHLFTEYSHKYTIGGFAQLASACGFSLHQHWTDDNDYFAILHLVNKFHPQIKRKSQGAPR